MKAFFETHRENVKLPVCLQALQNGYKAHFHSGIEVFILQDGEYKIKVNDENYTLKGNSVAFFSSYDVHEYIGTVSENFNSKVVIFPFTFCEEFISRHKNESIKENVIESKELTSSLSSLIDNYLKKDYSYMVKKETSSLFFSLIEEKLKFIKGEKKGETILIKNALSFIHENYDKQIKVKDIAKNIGYSVEHLSRVFKKYLGRNILEYINDLRLDKVNDMTKKGEKITTAVFEAGFSSLASYYRNKKRT